MIRFAALILATACLVPHLALANEQSSETPRQNQSLGLEWIPLSTTYEVFTVNRFVKEDVSKIAIYNPINVTGFTHSMPFLMFMNMATVSSYSTINDKNLSDAISNDRIEGQPNRSQLNSMYYQYPAKLKLEVLTWLAQNIDKSAAAQAILASTFFKQEAWRDGTKYLENNQIKIKVLDRFLTAATKEFHYSEKNRDAYQRKYGEVSITDKAFEKLKSTIEAEIKKTVDKEIQRLTEAFMQDSEVTNILKNKEKLSKEQITDKLLDLGRLMPEMLSLRSLLSNEELSKQTKLYIVESAFTNTIEGRKKPTATGYVAAYTWNGFSYVMEGALAVYSLLSGVIAVLAGEATLTLIAGILSVGSGSLAYLVHKNVSFLKDFKEEIRSYRLSLVTGENLVPSLCAGLFRAGK